MSVTETEQESEHDERSLNRHFLEVEYGKFLESFARVSCQVTSVVTLVLTLRPLFDIDEEEILAMLATPLAEIVTVVQQCLDQTAGDDDDDRQVQDALTFARRALGAVEKFGPHVARYDVATDLVGIVTTLEEVASTT